MYLLINAFHFHCKIILISKIIVKGVIKSFSSIYKSFSSFYQSYFGIFNSVPSICKYCINKH